MAGRSGGRRLLSLNESAINEFTGCRSAVWCIAVIQRTQNLKVLMAVVGSSRSVTNTNSYEKRDPRRDATSYMS